MEFNIIFEDYNDLYLEDSSLSLGWFEIVTNDGKYPIFKRKECMIYFTLSDLLNILINIKKHKNATWVAEDGGETTNIKLNNHQIILKSSEYHICLDYKTFLSEVIRKTENLLIESVKYRQDIKYEVGYKELSETLKEVKKTNIYQYYINH